MRVGVYIGNISPQWGGAFTFEKSMVDALIQNSHPDHQIFIFHVGKMSESANHKNVQFIELPEHPFTPKPMSLPKRFVNRLTRLVGYDYFELQLKKIWYEIDDLNFKRNSNNCLNHSLLENKIDLVWFPSHGMIPVQIPFMMTLWDMGHRDLPVFPELNVSGATWEEREKAYQGFLWKTVKVMIGTESGKEDLSFYYNLPKDRIAVAPFPVPEHILKTKTSEDKIKSLGIKNPFLFYPAQFWPHKNHILCLLALKKLKDQHNKNFDFVFTGSDKGNMSFIKAKAKELGLEKNVHFLGFVDDETLVSLYKSAFAMVFPTFLGPDNIPPMEAFALGCPVIASDIRGAQDQMKDAAILIDPKREDLFAEAIAGLDENKKSELRDRGFALAKKRTAQIYIHDVYKAIDDLTPYRRCWSNEKLWEHL